jgi:hypothetical protein
MVAAAVAAQVLLAEQLHPVQQVVRAAMDQFQLLFHQLLQQHSLSVKCLDQTFIMPVAAVDHLTTLLVLVALVVAETRGLVATPRLL